MQDLAEDFVVEGGDRGDGTEARVKGHCKGERAAASAGTSAEPGLVQVLEHDKLVAGVIWEEWLHFQEENVVVASGSGHVDVLVRGCWVKRQEPRTEGIG